MADALELLKELELTDEQKTKLVEKLNPVLSDYDAKLADANGKLQEAIETRQKAKNELKDLREKFVSGDFDGKKDLEAQIKLKEIEVTNLNNKITETESKLALKEKELESIETESKAELKEHFSEDEWKEFESWKLADLRKVAKLKVNESLSTHNSKRVKTFGSGGKDTRTSEEKFMSIYKS